MKFVLTTFTARMNTLPMDTLRMAFTISLEQFTTEQSSNGLCYFFRRQNNDKEIISFEDPTTNDIYSNEEIDYFTNTTQDIEIEENNKGYELEKATKYCKLMNDMHNLLKKEII